MSLFDNGEKAADLEIGSALQGFTLRSKTMRDKVRQMAGATLSTVVLLAGSAFATDKDREARNFVKNPGFEIVDEHQSLPIGWRPVTPRAEISPVFELDNSVAHSGKYSARVSSKGSPGTFGYWTTTVPGIQGEETPGAKNSPTDHTITGKDFLGNKGYRVRCYFRTKDLESVDKNVWIRVRWNDANGQLLSEEYLSSYAQEGGWYKAEQVLRAPLVSRSIDLELVLRWAAEGTVWWDDISVEEATLPAASRKIKVATISYQPPAPSTPEKNRQFYAEKVAAAGKEGADIICLGEGITAVSAGVKYADVAESVPGPTSRVLGELAKRYSLYVVVGIYEREGPLVYNTALLIDRKGDVVGKYRKTHLPETEVNGGIIPGTTYPVFKTDFGTVGLQICYDNFFPEVARNLALQGAEIIFLPIWGDIRGNDYQWDVVARARAIDNAVYMVASIYDTKRSLIIDPSGHILADTGGQSGMVMAELNLDARTFERWLSVGGYGEWKNLYPRERRPETYGPLAK